MTFRALCISSISDKTRWAAGAKLIVALSLIVASATLAGAQCIRCCFPASNLSVTPATAEEGQPVVLMVSVVNCQPFPRVITVKINVTPGPACESFAEAFSISAYIPRPQARTVTYTFDAPKCVGPYKVTESSSNAPGTVTKTLTVD
jgi:hypothetical protein